ncbi:MAG: T9SS type A sorting domain-containing protein [Bacteroidales bacterium]|nr:T9SS type A sorting domain-containing protein [Bacteroidales bacterium]
MGGIVGYLAYTSINKCYQIGTFNMQNNVGTYYKTSNFYVGGIVGYSNASSSTSILVKQSFHKGNLTVATKSTTSSTGAYAYAYSYVGGIFGYQNGGYTTISDCYNRGDIIPQIYSYAYNNSYRYAFSYVYVGGLIGNISSVTNTKISNCYNTGNIPSSFTDIGGNSYGYKYYYHDCLAYNTSGVTQNNSYYWDQCNCTNNYNNATSKTRPELIALQMPGTLNGSPSSGIWTRDNMPYVNNGYPIFGSITYTPSLSADSVSNLTAASADLHGTINTTYITPSVVSETGLEYKVLGEPTYTQVPSTKTNGSFQISTGILTPCTTYVYRAYAIIDGNYAYSDTTTFNTLCQPVTQLDTTICFNETLHYQNQSLYPDGEYIFVDNNTTYTVKLRYYPSNTVALYDTIDYGNVCTVNGISYYTAGIYNQVLGSDVNGCDSSITLYLTVNYSNSTPDVWDCSSRTIWAAGDGSQATPYIIESAANLCYLADQVNSGTTFSGKYFLLTRDIDINNCTWPAIGSTSSTSFRGHFDGGGHKISNMDILLNGNINTYGGLFGRVVNGSVENLYITGNSTLTAQTSSSTYYLGSVVGYASGSKITNCQSDAKITITNTGYTSSPYSTYAGGIIGYATSCDTIKNCRNNGDIKFTYNYATAPSSSYTWNHNIGGIVGRNVNTSVYNCANTGKIDIDNYTGTYYITSYVYAGGIIGYNSASSSSRVLINQAYNTGNIILSSRSNNTTNYSYHAYSYVYAGAITGYQNGDYTTIDNCYNRGNYTSKMASTGSYSSYYGYYYRGYAYLYLGGIGGYVATSTNSTIRNSYNAGLIPSTYTIVASNSYTNFTYNKDCMAVGAAMSTNNTYFWDNCLCGSNVNNSTSKDSSWLASASAFGALNGSPSSGVWGQDVAPEINIGFPIFANGLYDASVYTLAPSNLTSSTGTLNGYIDTTNISLSDITSSGFEYKLLSAPTYTNVGVITADTIHINLGGLQPCSTYVYRAYIVVNGIKTYGDEVKFTLGCHDFEIDTTICDGETFELFDKTFDHTDYYQFNVGSYSYSLDLSYYPPAVGTVTVTLCKGQKYYVGNSSYSTAGTYVVDAGQNAHGCDSILNLTIVTLGNINPPTVNILSADASVCPGGNTTLTASGADSYVWSTDETTPSITGTEGIVYTVTGTDAGTNCTATATISVPASLKVTISGDTVGICAGSSGTLTAAGADSYVWSTNETSPSITISPATTTTYWVKGTKGGCTDSVAVTVDVENYPIITISGAASVCAGESVVLTANGAVSYTWSTNENTPSVSVAPSFTTSYTVTGTTASGCSNTAVHTVTAIQPAQSSFTVNSSTPYSWNGQVYSTSGAYTQTFQRPGLCDSIVTLNLNIVSGSSIIKDTICKGDVYASFGFNIDTKDSLPGEYYYSINSGGNSISLNLYVKYAGSHTYIDTICKGNTYNNHGFTVNTTDSAAGTYSYTINYPIVGQCDSLVTLKLTVTPQPAPIDIYDTVCYGTPYYNSNGFMVLGLTDSVVGTHHLSSTSQIGDCYQTTNLYLTLNDKSYVHYYDTICQGNNYTGNGFTELTSSNAAGSYTFKKEVVNGYCRDTAVLHLFINEIDTINVTETICYGDSYSGYGFNNLSAASTYTGTIASANGCGSVVNLTLIVNPVYAPVFNETVCHGEPFVDYGFGINTKDSTAGTYTYIRNLKSADGCDSIVTLNLTISAPIVENHSDNICKGEVYTQYGFVIKTDTATADATYNYSKTYYTSKGCDSTINLALTVKGVSATTLYDTICAGSAYTLNGFNVATAGTHTLTKTAANGCDSIVTLHLTVNPLSYTTIYDTINQGEQYNENGFSNVSTAGIHTLTATAANGCDSIVTLYLTVKMTAMVAEYDTICEGSSYSGHGFVNISTPGLHSTVVPDHNGQDSTIYLYLTVNPTVYTYIYDTICEGDAYNSNGFANIKTSGMHTLNTSAANGCDSIVNLLLTVKPFKTTTLTASICQGSVYNANGFNKSVAGTYHDTLTAANGCDSIVTLILNVNNTYNDTVYATAIIGDVYSQNGFNVNTAGMSAGIHYLTTGHLFSSTGCDSMFTVVLTLNAPNITTYYDTICHSGTYIDGNFTILTKDSVAGTYLYSRKYIVASGDSTVQLYLTINPQIHTDIYDTTCAGQAYIANGFSANAGDLVLGNNILNSNVIYTSQGCDSTATLYLFVKPTKTTNITDAVCQGESYTNYGFNVTNIQTQYPGTASFTQNLTTSQNCDSTVILTLTINEIKSTSLTDVICKGGVYTDNGFIIRTKDSVPGTYNYVQTLKTVNGCDSTVTLTLTIDNPIETVFSDAITAGTNYVGHGFITGSDTMVPGSYTFVNTFNTPNGCDSIVTLHLVINNAAQTTTLYDTVCHGSGNYNNFDFSFSTYGLPAGTHIYTNTIGDSTVNLFLTVNPIIVVDMYDTTCGGPNYTLYDFNIQTNNVAEGVTVDQSHTTYTASGCDSTTRMHLLVHQPVTTNIAASVCQGDEYNLNGFNVTSAQTQNVGTASYTQNLYTINNCDSTVILTLTVNEVKSTSLTDAICKGGVYTDNGFIIKTKDSLPGTYNYVRTLKTTQGCDSIVTLTLTVNVPLTQNVSDVITAGNNYVGYGFNTHSDTLSAGTYTFSNTYHTPDGCDSVVTLTLTVNNAAQTTTLYDSVCHGVGIYSNFDFSINTTGLSEGTYTHTRSIGDSTVILYLTVRPTIVVDMYDTTCGGPNYTLYDFNIQTNNVAEGVTVDQSHTTYNASGCDSITRMHLLIHQPVTTNIAASVCQGDEYNLNGFNVTSIQTQSVGTTSYTQNLHTVNNCDSTVILTLTVNEVKSTSLTDAVCKGGVYTDYNFVIKTKDSVPGTYTYIKNLKTAKGCDSTVTLTLTINLPITENFNDAITAGNNYIGYGFNTHSDTLAPGTYTFSSTYHTSDGCDSVVILTLVVNNPAQTTTIYDTVCHGIGIYGNYDFSINTTGLAEGTYTHTRAIGDSTVILYLTVKPTITVDIYDTVCGGANYMLHGFNIVTANIADGTIIEQTNNNYTAGGCDSATTLHLVIHQADTTWLTATVCQGDEYNLYGFNVTSIETGTAGTTTYTQNLSTQYTCDSTVILTLTVNEVKSTTLTDAICKGGVYTDYDFVIKTKDSTPGTYTYIKNLKSDKGCDSTVTLTLTINNPIENNFNEVILVGTSYIGHGFVTNSDTLPAGTYTYTNKFNTPEGCDSLVILTLVINNPASTTVLYDTVCHGVGIYSNYDFTITTTGLAPGTYLESHYLLDSTVHLYLTVNPPIHAIYYDTICSGSNYSKYGFSAQAADLAIGLNTFNSVSTYTADGCDSSATLYLTVNKNDTTLITATVCKNQTYIGYGFNIPTDSAGVFSFEQNLSNANNCDSTVILQLTVNEIYNTILNGIVCKGGVYTDNGFIIKTKDSIPGTYQYNRNLLSATGCDSVITLNLTIDNPIETYFNESVIVGTNYVGHGFVTGSDTLSANIYTFTNTYHTPDGCDSVVILNLTVNNPASTITIYDTVCHGIGYYTGYDFTINTTGLAAGTYLHTHQFVDSTVNLYLTVNPTIEVDIYDTACAGPNYGKYNFAIVTSTLAEGTYDYTQSTYNSTGCDSITNLHLTIHPTKATNLTAAVCQGEAFTDYGFNVTGTETENVGTITRTQNLFTVHGCDSIVTLTLTINAIKATALSDVICKGAVYTDYGFIIKTKDSVPGTYSYIQNLKTINGCDSIVTLTLVIDNPIENNLTASITIGESYIANGFVIYSDTAGIGVHSYSQTYHTADGCDSVVNLTLTINSLVPMTILYDSICHGGFYLNSQLGVYVSTIDSTPGTYSFTRDFIDSVVILYLTINAPETNDVYDSICQGNNYNANGFSLTTNTLAAGNYEYQKTTFLAGGCESITYLHLTINAPSATTLQDFICQNSPYTAYGFNITSAQNSVPGTYTHTLNTTNRFGCDSIVTLTLTVTPETHTNLTDNICKGEVYINNGFAIITKDSAAGTYNYTQNLKTAAGCDSIITLALTIDPVYNTVIYDTICQNATPYTLYGFNESANGTYTQNLTTAKGCDSIVTLNLVVNPTAVTNITATICKGETYKQYGFNESVAGPYTQHLFTVNGCDSTVNLNLIVNDVYNISLTDEICKGDVYVKNGFTVITKDSTAGTYSYTQNLKTVAGCDSIVTLTLTINPVYNIVIYDTICQNATPYTQHGFNASQTGIYTKSLTTATGCDSIVTLNLLVNSNTTTTLYDEVCQGESYHNYNFNIASNKTQVAGVYTYMKNLQASTGCDSVVKLILTVNANKTQTVYDNVCHGDVYIGFGFAIRTEDSIPSVYTYVQNLQTSKGCDSVVTLLLTINPVYNTVIYDTICQGDAYTQYGFNESANGTYTQNLKTVKGCDSIITLNLTVNPVKQTNLTATICAGEKYTENGFNEFEAGPHTQNLQTADGCDSIVTLMLIINPVKETYLKDTVCHGEVYYNNGFIVFTKDSAAGTYNYAQTLTTSLGCDSTVYLELTINQDYNIVVYDTIESGSIYAKNGFNASLGGSYTLNLSSVTGCDSIVTLKLFVEPKELTRTECDEYDWNGITYKNSGVYTQTVTSSNGTDSTIILNLIVTHSSTADVYKTNCDTFTWFDSTYTASGNYTHTLIGGNSEGCDSIITLHLTILKTTASELSITACEEYRWEEADTTYYESGDYIFIMPNAAGCDSIITLHLTINQPSIVNVEDSSINDYTWEVNGETYHESGVYSHTIYGGAENGCDSTIILTLTIKEPDGIGDITAEAVSVTAYPNPASDHIDLRIEAAGTYTNSRYQLFDVIGKLVTDGKVEGEVTRIGTAQLAPGTYFLRVILANDDIRTIKVVKR